jgi:hypothetical protein
MLYGSYRMKQGKKHQTHIEPCNFDRFVPDGKIWANFAGLSEYWDVASE